MMLLDRLADRVRTAAYLKAIKAVLKPGMRILELGEQAGPLALAALRLGAEHAVVLQRSGQEGAIQDMAHANGLAEKITVLNGRVDLVQLDEPVDLLLADPREDLPDYAWAMENLVTAQARFLKPHGVVIPLRDRLWLAPGHWETFHEPLQAFEQVSDLDLRQLTRYRFNQMTLVRDELAGLESPRLARMHDYATGVQAELNFRGTWQSTALKAAHGLFAWFDTDLADGVGFSSRETSSYQTVFFPFSSTLDWGQGRELQITLRATPTRDGCAWTWTAGSGKVQVRHCSLFGSPVTVQRIEPPKVEKFA